MNQYILLKDAIDPAGTIWNQNADLTFGPYNIPQAKLDANPLIFQPYNPSGQWTPINLQKVWSFVLGNPDEIVPISFSYDKNSAYHAFLISNNLLFPTQAIAQNALAQVKSTLSSFAKGITNASAVTLS